MKRKAAASQLGKARTPKKAAAARVNGALGGKPRKEIEDYVCTCGAVDDDSHKSNCPRGNVIYQRKWRADKKASQIKEPPTHG